MKKNPLKFMTIAVLLLTFYVLFNACKKEETYITLNKYELTLAPGETETLIATLSPNANKKINWRSDDPTVVTVNSDGVVTALAAGYTTIVASARNSFLAYCEIMVYPANYFGDWDFVVKRFWRDPYEDAWASDTVYYLGKIEYKWFSTFSIEYIKNTSLTVYVNQYGELSYNDGPYLQAKGKFEGSDKVHIDYGYYFPDETIILRIIDGTKR